MSIKILFNLLVLCAAESYRLPDLALAYADSAVEAGYLAFDGENYTLTPNGRWAVYSEVD